MVLASNSMQLTIIPVVNPSNALCLRLPSTQSCLLFSSNSWALSVILLTDDPVPKDHEGDSADEFVRYFVLTTSSLKTIHRVIHGIIDPANATLVFTSITL